MTVSLARVRRQPARTRAAGPAGRRPELAVAGARDPDRDAGELPREQALVVRALSLLLRAALLALPAQALGVTLGALTPAQRPVGPQRAERAGPARRAAGRPSPDRRAGARDRDRRSSKIREESASNPGAYSRVFLKGQTRWQVSYYSRGQATSGDRPGADRRPHRRGAGGLDRRPGRVDDGPRLPGRVRAQGQLALGLDHADDSVPCAVRRAAAAQHAAARPRGARRVRRSRSRSSTTRGSTSRCRSSTRCSPTCWRARCGSGCGVARSRSRRGRFR